MGDSAAERSQKDITMFGNIIREELRLNVRVSKAFRAGRKVPDRPRLMIATLENIEPKMELLKMASRLRNSARWHSLYINPDLTQKEREDGKQLRQELADRKKAREKNIYIRQGKIVWRPSGDSQQPQSSSSGQDTEGPEHHSPPVINGSEAARGSSSPRQEERQSGTVSTPEAAVAAQPTNHS